MRRIVKRQPPQDLGRYVERANPQKWEEVHQNQIFPHLYEDCIGQLREEQANLSGYTEKPLPQQGTHVDHFRKQSLFNSREFVFGWDNLIADEHSREYGADHKDNVITSKEAYQKLIDPVAQDPHHFFTYMENGMIMPKEGLGEEERKMAEFTIDTFNLQHPTLLNRRENIIRMVKSYRQGGLSNEDILQCVGDYGFPSAVNYALM